MPLVSFSAKFQVRMKPKSKGRARVFMDKQGRVRSCTPPDTTKAEDLFILLSNEFHPPELIAGPVAISLTFRFEIAKSRKDLIQGDHHVGRPDVDNLKKLVLDAMTRAGVWWKDDSQVCIARGEKVYDFYEAIDVHIVELKR